MTTIERGFYPQHKTTSRHDSEEILATLDNLRLPREEYFLIGGANLVLRGVVELTPDIDMLVSDRAFNKLARRKGAQIKQPPARALAQGADNTSVWLKNDRLIVPVSATTALGDGYYPMSFESHLDKVESVKGIPCLDLESVTASKEAIQRLNDQEHLRDIASFTGRNILPFAPPTIVDPFLVS